MLTQHSKMTKLSAWFALLSLVILSATASHGVAAAPGSWKLLLENAGISAMHAAVTHYNNVVFLDRTDIGPSKINLPNGVCRDDPNDAMLKHDCTAHSVLFTPGPNTVRPLMIQTDTWCSSGQFFPDGTLVQTGGDADGYNKVRYFAPCPSSGTCNWVESDMEFLGDGRWYASNQLLPDGTQIVVGGRGAFTYEFIPANGRSKVDLPFLQQTTTDEFDNLYPFVHLLPDGNLYIFANRDSIILDYAKNKVVKTFPTIPGEPRNYPAGGSSVMLPLQSGDGYSKVEVLVCGGAQAGAFHNPGAFYPASGTCGRIVVTNDAPAWDMSTMPYRRVMGDMLLLPTGDVLIINGAQNGCQGWGFANNPTLAPVIYQPASGRFIVQTATNIPRLYHSIAVLLTDGRVLVAGSNTHQYYTFDGDFPTELRVEAFSPDYLSGYHDDLRPSIVDTPAKIGYKKTFTITVNIPNLPTGNVEVMLRSSPFSTHSFSQGQRLLNLEVSKPVPAGNKNYNIDVASPPWSNLAPPAYYMLFVVNQGIPSTAAWVQVGY